MKKISVAAVCVVALGTTLPAFAEGTSQKEVEMLRDEMEQMRNSQKRLQAKIDALTAAQSRSAREAKAEAVPTKAPSSWWPAGVQFPAPVGAIAPSVATLPQTVRASQTGFNVATPPGVASTLTARVWGVDVGVYGFFDVSFDRGSNGTPNPAKTTGISTFNQVSTNDSVVGIAGGVDLGSRYWRAVYQLETAIAVSATPGADNSLGSGNSFVGFQTPYGRIAAGKYDTPYKLSTALMDPFAGTIGDYNAIMGNSAGEGRAEFDVRMPHSVFYDSPDFYGLSAHALYSPGQKLNDLTSANNNAFPQGELVCSGSQQPSLNGAIPNPQGTSPGVCNDGAFRDAYSVSVNYNANNWYLTGSYELHKNVNRQSDAFGVTADEAAAKGGVSYHFAFNNQLSFVYEQLYRYGSNVVVAANERQRSGIFVSDVQDLGFNTDLMASYSHAGQTPGSPKFPGLNDEVDMFSLGLKYHINEHASVYLVGAHLSQGAGAHYGLGAADHGAPILSPRINGGAPYPGQTISAASSGVQVAF